MWRDTLWSSPRRTRNQFICLVLSALPPNLMNRCLPNLGRMAPRRCALPSCSTVQQKHGSSWSKWSTAFLFYSWYSNKEMAPKDFLLLAGKEHCKCLHLWVRVNKSQLEFCTDLIHKLLENFWGRKDQGRPRIHPLESRFTKRHFPEHVPYNEKGRPEEQECAVAQGWWAGQAVFIYVPRL